MEKYNLRFECKDENTAACIHHFIKNIIDENSSMEKIDDRLETKHLDILPSLDFVSYMEGVQKPYEINYYGRTKRLTRDDFIHYCKLILKKFDTIDVFEQYNILKRCGIPDDAWFLLFPSLSVSDIESLVNGNPYPYVMSQWKSMFSRVVLDVQEEQERQEIKQFFNKKENVSKIVEKSNEKLKRLAYDRKDIVTIDQFINYLNTHNISGMEFYRKYKISFQIINGIKKGVLPTQRTIDKINQNFGSNISITSNDADETIKVSSKNFFGQMVDKKYYTIDQMVKLFGISFSTIWKSIQRKSKLQRSTKQLIVKKSNGKIKFID